jgi:hypothetical protein
MKKVIIIGLLVVIAIISLGGCSPTLHDDGWVKNLSTDAYDNQHNIAFVELTRGLNSIDLNTTIINLQTWIDTNNDKSIVSISFVSMPNSGGFLIYYK